MDIVITAINWIADNKVLVSAVIGSGILASVGQWVLNHWMNSKKVIHTSLLILSTVISVGDLAILYEVEIVRNLPATLAGVFTVALTFYRFGGKTLFTKLEQAVADYKTGKSLRRPAPTPQLPLEEFATAV